MIKIKGARTHNLKNIDVEIPHNKITVITGLSGSGKSSLAFDTLFAEGQRRFVESLSAYARQFLIQMEKPDIDQIEGLSPAISIDQKTTSHNPRSTVGTITEIHDYLRLLYARIGTPYCPEHAEPLDTETVSQMVDRLMQLPPDTKLLILTPIVRGRKGEYARLFEKIRAQGFVRVQVDGDIYDIDDVPKLALRQKHTISAVVDRIKIKKGIELRLAESIETALRFADGIAHAQMMDDLSKPPIVLSENFACPVCGYTLNELEPRLFSFNSPAGACSECDGLGEVTYLDESKIVNPHLSLEEGAISGRDSRNPQYMEAIQALAKHYKFDTETPFKKLPKRVREAILYGSSENIVFRYRNDSGGMSTSTHTFVGIIPSIEDTYDTTSSEQVRTRLKQYMTPQDCPECDGTRLHISARNVLIEDTSLPQVSSMTIEDALDFFNNIKLDKRKMQIAEKVLVEIGHRLSFLSDVGLNYLNLNRSAESLSGGESQRIRLASQIGSGLVGVMYILDEPSIGLHQRDNQRLLDTLVRLRDLGNTVIVVEHDEEAILHADHVIDIGPLAGKYGGEIVAQGTPKQIIKNKQSLTGKYLAKELKIDVPKKRVAAIADHQIIIEKASGNNLKNITVPIPLGLFICITGVSGSGKSTLINETLYKRVANEINRGNHNPAPCKSIKNLKKVDKVVDINQSPIGRTPRSNPATYVGLMTPIREIFSQTPEARARGYLPGRFSFNVKGGRCEACEGAGVTRVEMHFLPDIYVTCDICRGNRYNRETLDILYKGKNISEVLNMTVEEAYQFFHAIPVVHIKLQTLMDVGLSYITLGQNSTTVSGGEAQRVKLSRELSKRSTGKTLYILDEPTTGLHFHDVKQLLGILHSLRDLGNTVIVIEHNMDVIKTADWVIDLGPEGGASGGKIIAAGTPEDLAKQSKSWTGRYLKDYL